MSNLLKNKPKTTMLFVVGFIIILIVSVAIYAVHIHMKRYEGATVGEKTVPTTMNVTKEMDVSLYQLPLNNYEDESFYSIGNSDIRYYVDNNYRGVAGIDVSHYQPQIDWKTVKEAGIEFAIIQVGYRGWGEDGTIVTGECFKEQIEGALAAGVDVGVYFFSQALNEEEAIEEAEYTLSLISEYDVTYPVVFDWEIPNENARSNHMNMLTLTSCADAFCRTIKEAGYEPCIYFNKDYGYEQLNLESLKEYSFWLAEYAEYPSFIYEFDMWQYSETGSVPGIDGNVDLNIMFIKK